MRPIITKQTVQRIVKSTNDLGVAERNCIVSFGLRKLKQSEYVWHDYFNYCYAFYISRSPWNQIVTVVILVVICPQRSVEKRTKRANQFDKYINSMVDDGMFSAICTQNDQNKLCVDAKTHCYAVKFPHSLLYVVAMDRVIKTVRVGHANECTLVPYCTSLVLLKLGHNFMVYLHVLCETGGRNSDSGDTNNAPQIGVSIHLPNGVRRKDTDSFLGCDVCLSSEVENDLFSTFFF